MTDYHPDKSLVRGGAEYNWCRERWNFVAERYDVNTLNGFKEALSYYLAAVQVRKEQLLESGEPYKRRLMTIKDPNKLIQEIKKTPLYTLSQLRLCTYQVVSDYILEQYLQPSYSKLVTDPRYRGLLQMELNEYPMQEENTHTEMLLRHAIKTYALTGEKMYFVSNALEQELRNTNIKGLPEEFFHLPYPGVYLVCPLHNPFKVYNGETGWHNVEGMYLIEDEDVVPRMMRIILIGYLNENSKHAHDDALYHWSLYLLAGKTIEECVNHSLAVGDGQIDQVRCVSGDNPQTIFSSKMKPKSEEGKIFQMMRPHLKDAFNYALNVMLYATHPDSEITGFNSSALYENFRSRAMKAEGRKRQKLLERAKSCKGKNRLMLGGSLVIDRRAKSEDTKGRGAGAKHTVRTYVSGHWQHFWVGEGRTERVYMRVRPYWKGPKDGPLAKKAHVIGQD